MSKNVIPRNCKEIIAEVKQDGIHSVAGDVIRLIKDGSDFAGENQRTGSVYRYFADTIRDGDLFRFIEVIK